MPWIDLHGHAGRCFLAGLPAGHQLVATMGPAAVADAVREAQAAGMTAVNLSAVADFAVLRPDPAQGLRAHRDFRPGEAYADYRRQLDGIRAGAAEAGAEMATSAADLERAARDGRTVVLLGCEGGDFLEGDLGGWRQARADGVTVLTLVHYRVNELGDVQTEAPVHGGLSRFGRDVVAECNRLGIVIDCAHASFDTTMAVLEASSQPVIISHGQLGHGGRRRRGHPRLMTAGHAAAVPSAGGLIGAWPCGFTSRSVGRLRDRDPPPRRGGRPGPRRHRHRPGRQLPSRPDQLRPARRPRPPAHATAVCRRPTSIGSSAATPWTC